MQTHIHTHADPDVCMPWMPTCNNSFVYGCYLTGIFYFTIFYFICIYYVFNALQCWKSQITSIKLVTYFLIEIHLVSCNKMRGKCY